MFITHIKYMYIIHETQNPMYKRYLDHVKQHGFKRDTEVMWAYQERKEDIQKIMTLEEYATVKLHGLMLNDFPYQTPFDHYVYWGSQNDMILDVLKDYFDTSKIILVFRNTDTSSVGVAHYHVLVENVSSKEQLNLYIV